MADDLDMWWRTPLTYPVSEYTTRSEMRDEDISQGFGWNVNAPSARMREQLIKHLPVVLGFLSPRNFGWASRTPSAITGGNRHGHVPYDYIPEYAAPHVRAIADSSAGLVQRDPRAFTMGPDPLGRTPAQLFYRGDSSMPRRQADHFRRAIVEQGPQNRNTPASDLRTPLERAWWLDRNPGGGG
jgi:hypothetical protein